MKTITIQRLTFDLDLVSWLEEIQDCLRYEPTNIWIGFSFLCWKTTNISYPIYIFAALPLAPFHFKFRDRQGLSRIIDEFKGLSQFDLLQETFVATEDDNPFANSGYRPNRLVCSYIWIRKYF